MHLADAVKGRGEAIKTIRKVIQATGHGPNVLGQGLERLYYLWKSHRFGLHDLPNFLRS